MTDTAPPLRTGVTIPFDDLSLNDHRAWIEEIADLGYTDVSCGESDDYDGFTPLVLASTWAPTLRLSNSIIPVFTRGPAVLAQTVAPRRWGPVERSSAGCSSSRPRTAPRSAAWRRVT